MLTLCNAKFWNLRYVMRSFDLKIFAYVMSCDKSNLDDKLSVAIVTGMFRYFPSSA